MTTIRAKYHNGVLTPLEPLEIEEGAEVIVSVEDAAPEASGTAKGGLPTLVEMIDRLRESYPPDMWDGLPTDLVKNKKHYLYGHPKEETRDANKNALC